MNAEPLVLMTADTVGGVWHYAVELAAGLVRRGVRVALATMGAPLTRAQRARVASLESVTLYESTYALEWMPEPWADVARAGEWLLDLEQGLRPDIVHLNQFAFGALGFRAPVLLVAHSCVLSWWRAVHRTHVPPEWDRYRAIVGRGLDGATRVCAPTHAMLRAIQENYGSTRAGIVIPNGRSAAAYPTGAKWPVVLTVGRLWDAAKNLAAIEAVAPQLAWPVVAAGALEQPGGGVREPYGVRALGELDSEALAAEYARAAIYALPARYEPFGLSVLEAALAGCALVLGDIASLREVWADAAVYVAPDDHEALGRALSSLITDAQLRAHYARAAHARASTYTPERMTSAYLAAYAAISKDPRRCALRTWSVEGHACAS